MFRQNTEIEIADYKNIKWNLIFWTHIKLRVTGDGLSFKKLKVSRLKKRKKLRNEGNYVQKVFSQCNLLLLLFFNFSLSLNAMSGLYCFCGPHIGARTLGGLLRRQHRTEYGKRTLKRSPGIPWNSSLLK